MAVVVVVSLVQDSCESVEDNFVVDGQCDVGVDCLNCFKGCLGLGLDHCLFVGVHGTSFPVTSVWTREGVICSSESFVGWVIGAPVAGTEAIGEFGRVAGYGMECVGWGAFVPS